MTEPEEFAEFMERMERSCPPTPPGMQELVRRLEAGDETAIVFSGPTPGDRCTCRDGADVLFGTGGCPIHRGRTR